jgi:deoxycytidylate deaminase
MEAVKLSSSSAERTSTTIEKVENSFSEELVIAICAPIGTRKPPVITALRKRLTDDYGYECEVIKLSHFIDQYKDKAPAPSRKIGYTDEYNKKINLIESGDELRKKYNLSVLAELAIYRILQDRKLNGAETTPLHEERPIDILYKNRRKCYIIDSIKNKEELLLLKTVYRELFYAFSVFTPQEDRESNLIDAGLSPEEAKEIILIDAEEGSKHGQNVRNTFVLGDFFVRVSNTLRHEFINNKINRFLHLIFDSEIITPTVNETAMYQAKSAANNSACLSRQVGATVTDASGHVLASGWNDVPKYKGNLYQNNDIDELINHRDGVNDHRCMYKAIDGSGNAIMGNGICFNDFEKNILAEELVSELVELGIINVSNKESAYNTIRTSKIKSLTEYSRAVHAEMHAIIIGSQISGNKMKGGKLFCTTYPCHNCARHIIVSGITEVYYIEPYTKSLCIKLHSDAITEDETSTDKVRILMFEGVAPNRYLKFFSIQRARKTADGQGSRTSTLSTAKPKTQLSLRDLPTLEGQAVITLSKTDLLKKSDATEASIS